MAVISIKNKIKSGSMLAGNEAAEPGSYESIASVVVGQGGISTVTFSNIPSTYQHLQIRALVKTTATVGIDSDSLYCYPLSGETTASLYSDHKIGGLGTGSGFAAGAANSANIIPNFAPLAQITNTFGAAIIDILDYTDVNKTRVFRSMSGYDANGAGSITFSSYRGGGLVAISDINLIMNGTFAEYSHFALYGIKG